MKKNLAVLLTLALSASLAACSSTPTPSGASTTPANSETGSSTPAPQTVIKFQMAENQGTTSALGVLSQEFCDTVKERTGGQVEIEFYGDGLLGDEATVVGMVEMGTVGLARVNLGAIQATVPELGVLTLPYLYKDSAHCYRVLNSTVGDELRNKCLDKGFVGLSLSGGHKDGLPTLSRSFYSRTPINSVADLKGKKIRVQESEVVIKMIESLGAVPTPMAYGEVFQALQTGVIDMAENDPLSYVTSGHYEVAKFYTYDHHQISPSIYIMSKKVYDSLSPEQVDIIMECLADLSHANADSTAERLQGYIKQAQDAGCTFLDIDTSEFQEICSGVYDMFPQYAEYVEKIKQVE